MNGLTYLLGAYFHQDWCHTYATWQEVLDRFLQDNRTLVAQTPGDIEKLLATTQDDAELERALISMGMAYAPDEGDRAWLEAVRDRILAHLSDTHPSDADDQGCAP